MTFTSVLRNKNNETRQHCATLLYLGKKEINCIKYKVVNSRIYYVDKATSTKGVLILVYHCPSVFPFVRRAVRLTQNIVLLKHVQIQ